MDEINVASISSRVSSHRTEIPAGDDGTCQLHTQCIYFKL